MQVGIMLFEEVESYRFVICRDSKCHCTNASGTLCMVLEHGGESLPIEGTDYDDLRDQDLHFQ